MSSSAGDRLAELLGPAVAGSGLVVDSVSITTAGRKRLVRVFVDLPEDRVGSADLDTVAAATREISEALDTSPATADVIGDGPYSLEVSTPGIDRPLRERRHWMRARTRLVKVSTVTGGEITGRVAAVDDRGVTLDVAGSAELVGWDRIASGSVQVEFRRVGALDAITTDEEDDEDDEEGGAAWTST